MKTPSPPDQTPPLAPITEPFKDMSALLPQTDCGDPALTVGASVIDIETTSVPAAQAPFPVELKVKLTVPAEISPVVGV